MKKLKGSLWAKLLAIVLLCLLALGCAGSTLAAGWLYDAHAYTESYDRAAGRIVNPLGWQYANNAGMNYLEAGVTDVYNDTNFRYAILDAKDDTLLFSNWQGEKALWAETFLVTAPHATWTESVPQETTAPEPIDEPEVTPTPAPQEARVTPVPVQSAPPTETTEVYCLMDHMSGETLCFDDRAEIEEWKLEHSVRVQAYVLRDMRVQDEFSVQLKTFDALYAYRNALLWIAGISFLLGILLFVFLMSAAGHRDETDAVTPSFVEKIPWDLFTAAVGLCIVGLLYLIGTVFSFDVPVLILCAMSFLLAGLLFLLWCMSTATRLKLGTLLKSCVIYRLLRGCWRAVKAVFRALGKLPLIWKSAVGVAGLAFIDLVWRMAGEHDGGMLATGWLLLWLLIGLAVCYAALAFRRLRLGAKRIAAGDESASVDTKRLIWDLKEHAEDLNNIREGLSRAVDERMKSERFKTELITNVSHDIKTPLTSIVSYVDLLSKEELENEQAREYVEVLQRQSERLKKLIDDLMEASKASTGNLAVELTRCELGVLLEQAAGEYAERLEQAGLTLVTEKPAEPVTVMADGRHLWRIFDNLLSNVCKYAQSGTRVYLTLAREEREAVVTFRNISRERLGVDGRELTERFVRGDSARSTEGSGLGLAIAQSLAQLQGAALSVTVDGGLFKVTLRFPVCE